MFDYVHSFIGYTVHTIFIQLSGSANCQSVDCRQPGFPGFLSANESGSIYRGRRDVFWVVVYIPLATENRSLLELSKSFSGYLIDTNWPSWTLANLLQWT